MLFLDQEFTLSGTDVLAYEVKIFIKRQNSPWDTLIRIVKRSDREQHKTRVEHVYKLFARLKHFCQVKEVRI